MIGGWVKLDEFKGRVETFAARLRRVMDARGMKNAELSRRTGISEQRIGQYARGSYEARQTAAYVIAKALRVNPAWLAEYDVPMEPSVDKKTKKCGQTITNDDLKLALFGTKEVNDDLLEDIKDIAKIHLELWKRKQEKPEKGQCPSVASNKNVTNASPKN
jgi:transcriptional regulator with XRE-family HTH domain